MQFVEQLEERLEEMVTSLEKFSKEEQEKVDEYIKSINAEVTYRRGKIESLKETIALLKGEQGETENE